MIVSTSCNRPRFCSLCRAPATSKQIPSTDELRPRPTWIIWQPKPIRPKDHMARQHTALQNADRAPLRVAANTTLFSTCASEVSRDAQRSADRLQTNNIGSRSPPAKNYPKKLLVFGRTPCYVFSATSTRSLTTQKTKGRPNKCISVSKLPEYCVTSRRDETVVTATSAICSRAQFRVLHRLCGTPADGAKCKSL